MRCQRIRVVLRLIITPITGLLFVWVYCIDQLLIGIVCIRTVLIYQNFLHLCFLLLITLLLRIMWDLFHFNASKVIIPTVIMFDLTLPTVILIAVVFKIVPITVVIKIVLIYIIIKIVVIYCIIRIEGWIRDVVSLPYLLLLIVDWNVHLLLLKTLLQIFGQIGDLSRVITSLYRLINVFAYNRYWLLCV